MYNVVQSRDQKNIETYGWQFQFVFDSSEKKLDFGYSIGFEESYNHPEVMIFGLKRDSMHTILSDIAGNMKNGRFFDANLKTRNLLAGEYEVLFKPLNESFHPENAGISMDYYNRPIRILVMLWPDKNNVCLLKATVN